MKQGNCYYTSEALYHLLGGKKAGWTPQVMRWAGGTHWFLKHKTGVVLDATAKQFKSTPVYSRARGCGFMTKTPSFHTRKLMKRLVWFHNEG